jgi:hypothetical protein
VPWSFDPQSVESIANAIARVATDEELGKTYKSGTHCVKDFDWERTAKSYRAVYRHAAGRTLTEEDPVASDMELDARPSWRPTHEQQQFHPHLKTSPNWQRADVRHRLR